MLRHIHVGVVGSQRGPVRAPSHIPSPKRPAQTHHKTSAARIQPEFQFRHYPEPNQPVKRKTRSAKMPRRLTPSATSGRADAALSRPPSMPPGERPSNGSVCQGQWIPRRRGSGRQASIPVPNEESFASLRYDVAASNDVEHRLASVQFRTLHAPAGPAEPDNSHPHRFRFRHSEMLSLSTPDT